MTPDELRALADESEFGAPDGGWTWTGPDAATEHLMSLAPALARLCAELGEALRTVAADAHGPGYREGEHGFNGGPVEMHIPTLMEVDAALAKLSELKSVT